VCYSPRSLPGALQSAQTSVLCSFLDISKVAEIERWMSAMMWLFRPHSPELPGRRLLSTDAALESPEAGWWDRFSRPADSRISRFLLRSLRPRPLPKSSLEPGIREHSDSGCLREPHNGIFTKSVRCIACNSPRDGSSLPVSFRTHARTRTHTHTTPLQPTYGGAGRGERVNNNPVGHEVGWAVMDRSNSKKNIETSTHQYIVFTYL